MDNQGDDFPGGSPSGRNNNVRGGSGLPNNIFSPSLRSIDPQYAAALGFEELRMRHQLEVQQDIEIRRRLMEEQQHQLLSELEYRNKIQQLQELQELQAQQQHQQQQQQGLNQLLAQNPRLLEMHQQQQYHPGRENSLLSSLRDDFLLQRHQLMLQDQMQQQLQEQLSRDSQQHEQDELFAMLQASGNLRGAPIPADISSLRQEEAIAQQPSNQPSPDQVKPPRKESIPAQLEEILNNSNNQRAESTSTDQGCGHPQTDVGAGTNKRRLSEPSDIISNGAPQDPPMAKKKKPAKDSPKINPSSSKEESSKPENSTEERAAKNKELDEKVAKLLESQKLPAKKQKDKGPPEKKGRKKKGKSEEAPVKNEGKKKKAHTTSQAGKKTDKKDGHGDDINKMLDHEQSIINFLGSRGKKNEKLKKSVGKVVDQNGTKKKSKRTKETKEHHGDEAANLILNFKCACVSAGEARDVKKWSRQGHTSTVRHSAGPLEKHPLLGPRLKFNLPLLPIEPEMTNADVVNMTPLIRDQPVSTDAADAKKKKICATASTAAGVEGNGRGTIRFISNQKRIFKPKRSSKGNDEWWPSKATIRKERSKLGHNQDEEETDNEAVTTVDSMPEVSFLEAGVEAAKERLANSVEPGLLEKLPHCKLYDDFCKEKKNGVFKPKFCCQTTETFPFEAMVCCSVCSTWRHAQCGGHHKRYTPESSDPSNVLFEPICDQCHFEKQFVDDNAVAANRIQRQRIEHLRRCNATNAVMRQVAFGKHSGQYKWPLGSVSISHISGHTRSVQARHEKAEKQWSEMASRLGNVQEVRPRERQRVRTRELERLLVSIEDAEGAMDRHNMMIFLQNDTNKLHPAGFEVPRQNIFDPEEDPVYVASQKELTRPSLKSLDNRKTDNNHNAKVESASSLTNASKGNRVSPPRNKEDNVDSMDQNKDAKSYDDADKDDSSKVNKSDFCCRQGCTRKPRFDSMFCSDSCGVLTLENDLSRTLQYAGKLHPSILRS